MRRNFCRGSKGSRKERRGGGGGDGTLWSHLITRATCSGGIRLLLLLLLGRHFLLFSSPLFFSTFFSLSGDATYSSYTFRPPRAFSATASSPSSSSSSFSRGRRLLNKCGIYTEEKCTVIPTTRRKFDKQIERKNGNCAVAFLFLGESLYETHFEYGRRVQLLLMPPPPFASSPVPHSAPGDFVYSGTITFVLYQDSFCLAQ